MKHLHNNTISCLILYFSLVLFQPTLAQEEEGVYVDGYGELHYNNVVYNANGEESAGKLDFNQFVLSFGYHRTRSLHWNIPWSV